MGEAFIVHRRGKLPAIFGNGSDGGLYIAAGQTVVLPVPIPYQSVVEKQYKSVTIQAGGVLRCSAPNAGLVIRCKGDCTIHGSVDQRSVSPLPNPSNVYPYPVELVCGLGGSGGRGGYENVGFGGTGSLALKFGGGYGAGGGGGGGYYTGGNARWGSSGGSTNTITFSTPINNLFNPGIYGGGGNGVVGQANPAPGGTPFMPPSKPYGMTAGGTGNYGGGAVLLYCGGKLALTGSILCSGGSGGNGGEHFVTGDSTYGSGGGAGGGGGGSVYILYNGVISNSATLDVNGGVGGTAGWSSAGFLIGTPGVAGGIGTVTIKQYVRGMTV